MRVSNSKVVPFLLRFASRRAIVVSVAAGPPHDHRLRASCLPTLVAGCGQIARLPQGSGLFACVYIYASFCPWRWINFTDSFLLQDWGCAHLFDALVFVLA